MPLLAALVSGLAGALLGGRAASRAAERTAALARQDEQRRWNRERRERAYFTLLSRRNNLVELDLQWNDAREDDPDVEVKLDRLVSDQLNAGRLLGAAIAEVELAGTAGAVELSRRWFQTLPPHRSTREKEEVAFRDQFVALIRKELGVDD